MKKKSPILLFLVLIIILANCDIIAQADNTFTPYGKPVVLIFTDVRSTFTKSDYSKSFDLTRAYLGYEYFFSKNISSKINIDVADPSVGKLQMTAFIKNAYVRYKKDNFSARFGMIGVDQFNIQEKQWGYRYIYKSFQDEYGFGPSADLGAAFEYSPVKYISVDVSILNGEGYKKLQADSTFKESIGLTIKPYKGFVLRGYFDMMNNNYNQTTMALYAGYTYKNIKIGVEYNDQKNNGMINNHDFSGVSLYSSVALAKKFTVFGRYDNLWSTTLTGQNDPWNYDKDGELFMAGFDYSPTPGVKIAPNFQRWSPGNKSKSFSSTIALNFEIKF
jgi:hypothetical protein